MTERGLYQRATHALRYWLLRRLPTCKQTVAVISQSLERPLTLRERVTTKFHLWVCIWCVRYLEHLHFMRDALRAREAQIAQDQAAGASLSPDARERMKSLLSNRSR